MVLQAGAVLTIEKLSPGIPVPAGKRFLKESI
jgi:hypothetical protein